MRNGTRPRNWSSRIGAPLISAHIEPGDIIRERGSRTLWRVVELYADGHLWVRPVDNEAVTRVVLHPDKYVKVKR